MREIQRALTPQLVRAARNFPAVVLTGPRRAGKTWALRHVFPKASWHLLEDPDVLAQVKSDPRGFLDSLKGPAIIDEIQNAPELFPYIRSRIDAAPQAKGRWLLTGSHDYALMAGLTESMAGRAAILQLLPLSSLELGKTDLLRGGYPEVWARPAAADLWFRTYVQSYLERDVRSVTAVRDLTVFRQFIALVAARNGQVLNRSDLATPMGVSVPTITQWLSVLETTGLIALVPPYFENFEKRLIKSPRLFWLDTGLLCHLLGITEHEALRRSAFYGPVFEAFVASELAKMQVNAGRQLRLFHFRDQQGLEVDFLVPRSDGTLDLLEVKSSRTVTPEMARPLAALRAAVKTPHRALVLHPGREAGRALAPGVSAMGLEHYLASTKP